MISSFVLIAVAAIVASTNAFNAPRIHRSQMSQICMGLYLDGIYYERVGERECIKMCELALERDMSATAPPDEYIFQTLLELVNCSPTDAADIIKGTRKSPAGVYLVDEFPIEEGEYLLQQLKARGIACILAPDEK
jgi:hypothetical protein